MFMQKHLVVYHSFSGNTEEVAEIIQDEINKNKWEKADLYRIGTGPIPDVDSYDSMIIGSFTWDRGSTPEAVKDFVADLGYKPDFVYVFGTGDTQFGGDELFCRAADKLHGFYDSDYPVLKVEQSPRGEQEQTVRNWAKGAAGHRWNWS